MHVSGQYWPFAFISNKLMIYRSTVHLDDNISIFIRHSGSKQETSKHKDN